MRQIVANDYDRVVLSWAAPVQDREEPGLSTDLIHTGPSLAEILLMPEVSELTRIPLSTLRFYRHSGQGPRSFPLGGRVVYKRADVEAWIESRYQAEGAR